MPRESPTGDGARLRHRMIWLLHLCGSIWPGHFHRSIFMAMSVIRMMGHSVCTLIDSGDPGKGRNQLKSLVGVRGFEPPTPASREVPGDVYAGTTYGVIVRHDKHLTAPLKGLLALLSN